MMSLDGKNLQNIVEANVSPNIEVEIKRGNEIDSNTIPLNKDNQIGVILVEANQFNSNKFRIYFF